MATSARRTVLVAFAIIAALPALATAEPTKPAPSAKVYRGCPDTLVWSEAQNGCVCPGALHWDTATRACSAACPVGKTQAEGQPPGTCVPLPHTCPPGNRWSELHNACVVSCPAGKAANKEGTGCVPDPHNCPGGTQWFDSKSACFPFCEPGKSIDYKTATCVDDPSLPATPPPPPPPPKPTTTTPPPPPPPPPPKPTASASTKPPPPRPKASRTECPEGKEWKDAFEMCVPICNDGEVLDFYGKACHPIKQRR
jgi:hypothetical protein